MKRDPGPDMSTYLGINLDPILGPLFWGTLVSMVLTGITILQAYRYFPSKDRPAVQMIALSMLLLDLLSSTLAAQGLHHYLLPHFGSTVPLGSLVPTLAVECVATTSIIVISQFYFAWQVYVVSQRHFVKYVASGTVVVLSLVAFAGGLGCSVAMFVHPANILAARNGVFNSMAAVAKVPAALADIVVTASLCYSLGYARTGMKTTDSVLKALIGFVIERGVLVTLIQTVFLLMFYLSSSHLYWLALHVNVTRVYANTFFAMLNGRERLREEYQTRSYVASGLGTHNRTHPDNTFNLSKRGGDVEADAVAVQQSVWMDTIQRGDSADKMGVGRVQVDRRIVVSDL